MPGGVQGPGAGCMVWPEQAVGLPCIVWAQYQHALESPAFPDLREVPEVGALQTWMAPEAGARRRARADGLLLAAQELGAQWGRLSEVACRR